MHCATRGARITVGRRSPSVADHTGELRALDRAPRLTIDTRPLAVLGGPNGDPEYDLTWARVVVPLADGRIVTLASVGNRLLVFRADGRGERSIGRLGKGPGELTAPSGMIRLAGDTLFIPDRANARYNLVTAGGTFASGPMRDVAGIRPFTSPVGTLPGGEIVLYSGGLGQRGARDSIVRPPTPVVALDRRSGALREIARIPDLELATLESRYRGRIDFETRPLRFTRRAHVVVWDTLLATSDADQFQIDLRTRTGSVVSQLRVPVRRRPVTRAMRDAQVARELARLTEGGEGLVDAAESQRLAREWPFAASLPPFGELFVTTDHTLWVIDPIVPGDTAWSGTAFRRDGAIIGRLSVSGASRPVAFGADRVVVRTEDEDGVVALRVHRLVAQGRPGR